MEREYCNPKQFFTGAIIPNCILRLTSISATAKLIFAKLCDHAGADGEVYPKQSTLAEEIGASRRSTIRALNELEELCFIEVVRPNGAEVWRHQSNRYRFPKLTIMSILQMEKDVRARSAKMSHRDVTKGSAVIKNQTDGEEYLSAPASAGVRTVIHERFFRMSRLLAEAISQKHKINRTSKVSAWAKPLSALHTIDGIDVPRIKKVLRWYCDHLDKEIEFMPIADSGESFRRKFTKIEAAIKRSSSRRDFEEGREPGEYHPKGRSRNEGVVSDPKEIRKLMEEADSE